MTRMIIRILKDRDMYGETGHTDHSLLVMERGRDTPGTLGRIDLIGPRHGQTDRRDLEHGQTSHILLGGRTRRYSHRTDQDL